MTLTAGETFSFYTRTESNPVPGDTLQVRVSTNGASNNVGSTTTSVGDFSILLTTVGTPASYPDVWTQVSAALTGFSGSVNGRIAFRYVCTDTLANCDYVGIDTVALDGTAAVPEPGMPLTLGIGATALAIVMRRRQKRA